MKNGQKPTLKQSKIMKSNKMDHSQWLVSKVLSDRLVCTHRTTEQLKDAFYKVV